MSGAKETTGLPANEATHESKIPLSVERGGRDEAVAALLASWVRTVWRHVGEQRGRLLGREGIERHARDMAQVAPRSALPRGPHPHL